MIELASLYRDIVEHSHDGIWVIDLDGNTVYANPVIARMYGIAHDQVGSLRVQDTLDEQGRAQFAEHLRSVRAGEPEVEEVEVWFVDSRGEGTWITLRETVLRDEEGNVTGLLHRIADYDERRRVLEELTASREQLQEAQRIARLGSWVYDVATEQVTVVGGGPGIDSHVPWASYDEFLELLHPDDVEATSAVVTDMLREQDDFAFDVRLRDGAGWVTLRVRAELHRGPDGQVVSIAGTHQDVTEIRATEAALRDEIEQAALLRAISAAANGAQRLDDVLGEALPLLLEHSTWTRAALYVVDHAGDLVAVHREHDDAAARADRALARTTLDRGCLTWSEDGTTVAVPIMVDDAIHAVGTITSTVSAGRRQLVETMAQTVAGQLGRVAEREAAQRALATARDEAMSASRQKSEFLATMSHEIRTPLNGIIGLNDLLMRTELDPEQHRLASGVHIAGRALLAVISDVLDYSKIDGREVELEEVDIDLRSMLDQVVRVLSGSAAAGGVELLVSCHHDVPASVVGDPTRLSQVLLNLVSNAVKFSPGGEVVVAARLESATEGQVVLRFEVRDTGIGIDPGQVAHLFEPFTQADTSTTRQYGGTGLGLAISRGLVTALRGQLSYEPNPGGGSIFAFTAVFADRAASVTPDDYARHWLAGKRILIADANVRRAEVLGEQLTWWYARPVTVAGISAARAALARSLSDRDPFEAVILDVGPGSRGVELATGIAGESAYDEIAMLAVGPASPEDQERLYEVGVSAVLGRPLPTDILRGTLLEQLAGVPAQPTTKRTPGADEPAPHGRVLVVEDNPVNQLVATGMLESLGCTVTIAHHGAHALDELASGTFDVVLMDVQMPVLDGYETTRTLREREAGGTHLPVIAMTAAAIDGERERCLAAGMDDFLTKPVDLTTLAAALNRWLPDSEVSMPDQSESDGGLPPTAPIEGLDTERLDMLRDLDPGDTTYIDRAIGNFQVNSAAAVEAIRGLVAAADAPALKAAAHKIAGSALNLGVPRAGEAARALERLADTGTTEGAEQLLPELERAMTEGRERLLAYQRTYSQSS